MLEGALDLVCMGVALARTSGEVMYANLSARKFLSTYALAAQSSIVREGGWQCRLRGRLAQIVQNIAGERQIWSSPNGKLIVEILPLLSAADCLNILGRRGGAMLMMRERGIHPLPTPEQLIDLFRLTPAEARTCLTLCQVDSAQKCASAQNVSLSTVRSQLRAAMQKTATSKQAELVSVILSVPVSRSGRG